MRMVQRFRIPCLILAVLIILSTFAGCGMSSANRSEAAAAPTANGAAEPGAPAGDGKMDLTQAADAAYGESKGSGEQAASGEADSLAKGPDVAQDVNNAILAERKIIRSANVTIEVDNFDEAYGKINSFILGIGFIQETNINSERIYVDKQQKLVKRGTIVLRVDKSKFDKVLNNVKGIGDVYNWTINGQDVTDKYIDIESRLRLLKLEEARLEEYLKKLTDLDQIFKTESRITEITQEIENLTGNLKKLGDLVELSTITINMNEKTPESSDPAKPATYGQRLLDNMLGSVRGVVKFCGELLIILVAALPVLILIGVLVLVTILIYRKISARSRRRTAWPEGPRTHSAGPSAAVPAGANRPEGRLPENGLPESSQQTNDSQSSNK